MMSKTVLLAILIILPQFTLQGLFDDIGNAIHDVGEKIDNVVEDIHSEISAVGEDIQSGISDISQDIHSEINKVGEEIHSGINELDEDIHSGISDINEQINDAVSEIEEEVHKAEVWTETSLAELRNDLDQGARDVEQFLDDHFAELGEDVQNALDQIKGSLSTFLFQLTDIDTTFKLIRESITQNATATTYAMDFLNNTDTSAVCEACEIFIGALKTIGALSLAQDIVEEVAIDVCDDTYNHAFCKQAVDLYADFIFDQIITKNVTNKQLCQRLSLCSNRNQDALINNFTQTILQDKPITSYPIPTNRSTYKILHLSDPHIDLEYQEGSNAACNSPLCCRAENGNAPNASAAAQYWGTNASCDIPLRTFTQFLQFAADNLEVDMIVWTGDNIAHDFWEESQNTQTKNTYNATEDILKYFPNTTVYPMFGNHEAYPIDEYDMVGNTTSWLTSQLADMWKPWLTSDAETSFRNYSYYAEVNTVFNFKLIALDTQACDNFDLYLIEDPDDPFSQLAWLRKELYDSESKNQSVFIVGHIPTVNFFCNAAWGQRYRALIDRFTNIIRGQFFGHSHYDQISVTRSFVDNSSVGVIFVAPSMTTYANLQPSFRILEVDADTNVIVNYYQYRLDLQKWNQNTTGPLEWDLAYDALSEYNLPNMNFQSFDNFADSIQTNTTLAQAYAFNWKSGSFAIDNLAEREIENYYCFTKFSVVTDSMQCLGLQADTSDKMLLAAQLIPGGWDYSAC